MLVHILETVEKHVVKQGLFMMNLIVVGGLASECATIALRASLVGGLASEVGGLASVVGGLASECATPVHRSQVC